MNLSALYHPLTATPLGRRCYQEAAPSAALRPYVRCFWRSLPASAPPTLVVPDTCMDLIFRQDERTGRLLAIFCALGDTAFISRAERQIIFAVRFYPWATAAFADERLGGTLNLSADARQHFPGLVSALLRMLAQTDDFQQRCVQAESILDAHFHPERCPADFLNAMHIILQSKGCVRAHALADGVYLSVRQLERLFDQAAGASPKQLISMVRYQNLWRDAVFNPRFDVQDAVIRYGYADQSHLLRQFKRYHSLTLTHALALARKEVAFVQSPAQD